MAEEAAWFLAMTQMLERKKQGPLFFMASLAAAVG